MPSAAESSVNTTCDCDPGGSVYRHWNRYAPGRATRATPAETQRPEKRASTRIVSAELDFLEELRYAAVGAKHADEGQALERNAHAAAQQGNAVNSTHLNGSANAAMSIGPTYHGASIMYRHNRAQHQ